MTHIPHSTDTAMKAPGQLATFFTRSMAFALAALGEAAGLDPLEWHARTLQGELVLQGSPPDGAPAPTELCAGWAAVLGLDEFSYDALEDVSTWSRYESPWLIDVSSEPL